MPEGSRTSRARSPQSEVIYDRVGNSEGHSNARQLHRFSARIGAAVPPRSQNFGSRRVLQYRSTFFFIIKKALSVQCWTLSWSYPSMHTALLLWIRLLWRLLCLTTSGPLWIVLLFTHTVLCFILQIPLNLASLQACHSIVIYDSIWFFTTAQNLWNYYFASFSKTFPISSEICKTKSL